MKRAIKILLSVIGTAYFAASMFFCFVAGAPMEKEKAVPYMIIAALFSILLCTFLCACLHYISYLQKKLDKQE